MHVNRMGAHVSVIAGVLLMGMAWGCGGPKPVPQVRIAALPEVEPERLIAQMDLLVPYLSESCDRQFTFTPSLDRDELCDAVGNGTVDLALMDVTAFQSVWLSGARRIVMPAVEREATSVILVADSSGRRDMTGLAVSDLLCTFQRSTAGHLMPLLLLRQNFGVFRRDREHVRFTLSAFQLCRMLLAGNGDAGAMPSQDWTRLRQKFPALRVIGTTEPFANQAWVVRGELDPALATRITQAFLRLQWDHPYHRRILETQETREFVRISEAAYRSVDRTVRAMLLDRTVAG